RYCIKWMGGNITDAEDALSRAMLKAWEKIQTSVEKIRNFKAWLTSLTRNLCMDIHRERSRSVPKENCEAVFSKLPHNSCLINRDNFPGLIHYKK
ncbi:MAG: sigma factor, partial [Geitlerinemataceae cyanobacterium]